MTYGTSKIAIRNANELCCQSENFSPLDFLQKAGQQGKSSV